MNAALHKSLPPGSSIALVAPASPFADDLYMKGREILEKAGYRTVSGKCIFNKNGYLAGNDTERGNDLTAAILDPSVAAIICIRGGYGSGRLLPLLPFSSFLHHPKIFIGHSDITFLHLALLCQANWTTFHGPNLTGMAESPKRAENVLRVLAGEASYEWELARDQVLRHGTASGPVLGGNLTCLAHLVGTPYLPDMTGALLLIEDRGEALYRLDRMMNHLKLADILPRLGGILLGEFTNCSNGPTVEGGPTGDVKICEMVMDHVSLYDFPVVRGLPFGHGSRNEVIPFGAPFLLDTRERVLRLL
ncbi:MAG: LD-carboxypeptidase [Syntrophobacteraceae bacterium]